MVFHCEPLLLCDVNIFVSELSRVLCALEKTRASTLDCDASAEKIPHKGVCACLRVCVSKYFFFFINVACLTERYGGGL